MDVNPYFMERAKNVLENSAFLFSPEKRTAPRGRSLVD
jgi:hypothetical protein